MNDDNKATSKELAAVTVEDFKKMLDDRQLLRKAVDMMEQGIEATIVTKKGEVPDWPIREKFTRLILAYAEGAPVKRSEKTTVSRISIQHINEKMKNPNFAHTAKRLLQKAQVIDVTPEPVASPDVQKS